MGVITGALIGILIVAPLFGFVSDRADPRVLVPLTFFVRGMIGFSFRFIEDPSIWQAYAVCVLVVIVSFINFISVEVLFMRDMKSDIRGTLSGIAYFFGSIGTTLFALLGGVMFDQIGPWAPFLLVGVVDFVVVIVSMIFIITGLIKKTD